MQNNNNNALLLIISAVIALSAGVWFGFDYNSGSQKPTAEIQGVILPSAKIIEEFNLIDNKNRLFNLQSIKNKWSILFFGYTHCPDVCPTTLNTLVQVNKLMLQKNITPPQFVMISIDPERDTAEILDQYVAYFNEDFIAVGGELNEVQKLAANLGIYFKKATGASGDINADDYTMDHQTSFIVVNPEGKVAAYLMQPHDPKTVVKDFQTVNDS